MRNVTIIGAGQSGLQLAIGLVDAGYDVTVVSNRTPEDIYSGKILSSQCMFDLALSHERALGLNFWDDECPPVEGIGLTVPSPEGDGTKVIDFSHRLDAPAQAVDQRLKMPRWIDELQRRGGKLLLQEAGIPELENHAATSDLVIIAAGKGEIARLFERDAQRSTYSTPQRALALTQVNGLVPRPEYSAVNFNKIPDVGEYFVFPALTTTGPCEIMVFEGIPDGPMDCWAEVRTPEQHLEKSLEILRTFMPWEAERAADVSLTDDNAVLVGRFPPTVRKPVAHLPSGRPVLGMADVVVLNDPITGQGSNNASKCATSYLHSILDRGGQPFDEAFLQQTFETYWDQIHLVAVWTNAMLAPPPPHVLELFMAANTHAEVAKRFANGFNDPRDFFEWLMDPQKANQYLASVVGG